MGADADAEAEDCMGADAEAEDCMGCCCGGIITIFLIAIVGLIISSLIHSQNYADSQVVSRYVQDLYVPSLAPSLNLTTTTTTTTLNGSVLVELRFEREKALSMLQCKGFQMTLYYRQYPGSSNFPVGSSVVEGFSMRRKMKRVDVIGKVEAVAMPWREALLAGNVGTMVVELRWPSNDGFAYTADVPVDASGHMKIKEPIQFH